MPKSKPSSSQIQNAQTAVSSEWPDPPSFSQTNTQYEWLLPDEVLVLHSFLTAKECSQWTRHFSRWQLDPPSSKTKKGDAVRTNNRLSIQDQHFAEKLWRETCLSKMLPGLLPGAVGLNANLRIYRYDANQFFAPHYDDAVIDPVTRLKSQWTLLLYLTGKEDGLKGGQTVFYRKGGDPLVVEMERGMVLLHKHGSACLLHESRSVLQDSNPFVSKWVFRSDVMFAK